MHISLRSQNFAFLYSIISLSQKWCVLAVQIVLFKIGLREQENNIFDRKYIFVAVVHFTFTAITLSTSMSKLNEFSDRRNGLFLAALNSCTLFIRGNHLDVR